jgi:hypothetical protein
MTRWQAAMLCVALAFLAGCSHGKKAASSNATSTAPESSGNAEISGIATGSLYRRTVVVHVKDRRTGAPIHRAKVVVHAEMTLPHPMTLYNKRLTESTRGEYKGPYTLIMPGDWKMVVIARSKTGDTSTGSFPAHVTG